MSAGAGPLRIVSLVPSVTEALFALGLGPRVVGVTDWCAHPAEGVARLARVGGTKDTDVAAVVALAPDLVLANREENTERTVRRLRAAGLRVRVGYPRTVAEGVALLEELAALGAPAEAAAAVLEPARRALAEARARRPAAPVRVFCPIWRDPWMAVSGDTYVHDLLALCGGENPWAGAERRYPVVSRAEVEAARPEVVLLPDEPYAFAESDRRELLAWDLPAARAGRIHLIDGTLVSWYGPRIPRAIETIRPLLSSAECS